MDFDTLFTGPAVLAKQLELRWASASVTSSSSASEAPDNEQAVSSDAAATAAEEKSKTTSSERGLPRGVSQLASGDFVSRIWWGGGPGKSRYIGRFNTPEEASAAYESVREELDEVKLSSHSDDDIVAIIDVSITKTLEAMKEARKKKFKAFNKAKAVEAVEKPRMNKSNATSESGLPTGVRTAPSGNYVCQINWGGKSCTIGTFATIEQASAAFVLVSAERDHAGAKPSAAAFVKAKKKALEAVEEARRKKAKAVSERGLPTGVYLQPSGNFESQIWWGNKLRYIGLFDTPEQASAAFVAVTADLAGAKTSAMSAGKMNAAFDEAKKKAAEAVGGTHESERGLPTGVYEQSSGSFMAQIWWGNKLRHIGTFDTPEQASAAYVSVKADLAGTKASTAGADAAFDEAKKKAIEAVGGTHESKRDLPTGVYQQSPESFTAQIWFGSNLRHIGTFDTPEQASDAYVSVKADLAGAKPSAAGVDAAFIKAKRKAVEAVGGTKAMSKRGLPTGVYPVSSGNFESQIWRGSKLRYIGLFDTPEQASAAYMSVKKDLDAVKLSSCSVEEVDAVFDEAKKKAVKTVGGMLVRKPGPRKGYKRQEQIEGLSQTHDNKASGNRCTAMGRPYLRRNLLYCRDPMGKSHFFPWEKVRRLARVVPELPPQDMLANLFGHTEPVRYNKALGKAMRTPLRKRKRRITPTTTPENTRIRIGENCRKVKTGDLVPNTRVLVAYKEKDLFRATVRELPDKEGGKYRVHYDSYKKDKTYLVPFSDFRALLDEDNCPLEITAPDPDSTSASSSSSSPQRTKLFFDVQMAQSPSQVLSPSTAEMQYGKAFPPYKPRDKSSSGKEKWNEPKDHRTAFELFAESNREQARLHLKRTDRKNKDKIDEQLGKLWADSNTTTTLYFKQEEEWDKQRYMHEQGLYTRARQLATGSKAGGEVSATSGPSPSPSTLFSVDSSASEHRPFAVPKRVSSVSYYYFHQRKGLPVAQIEQRSDCLCPLCFQNCITDVGCVMHCQLVHGGDLLSFQGMKDEEGALHIGIHPKAPKFTNTFRSGKSAGAGIDPVGCARITNHTSGWDPADALRQKPLTNSRVGRDFVYSRQCGRGPILAEIPLLKRSVAAGRKRKHQLLRDLGADADVVRRIGPEDPIPVRQYYHSKTNLPKRHDEWKYDSDDESDDSWMEMKSNQLIDEFDDVSEKEKYFLKLWNTFMSSSILIADRNIPSRCVEFVKLHGTDIAERGMRQHLFLHFTNLWDEGILSSDHVSALMLFYDRQCAATADTGKRGKSGTRSAIPRAAKSPNHHRKKTPIRSSVSSPGPSRMSASRKRAKRCIAL